MSANNDESGKGKSGTPKVLGKEALRPPLPKRFYKEVSVAPGRGGSHEVRLDGRSVKTPKKRPLAVPTPALAEAIAGEWRAQGAEIDPATMPMTRIANTAIDAVSDAMAEVAADLVAFAGSDLLCYRAEGPEALQERQAAAWDPVLAWVREALGARFLLAEGVMPVTQPEAALAGVGRAVAAMDAFALSALHVMTTLTGSALLALAQARGILSPDAAWAAAHVDEDYQIELWGPDAEAEARRAYRKTEFDAASRLFALLAR